MSEDDLDDWEDVFHVSDDHSGLPKAMAEIMPESLWQRCYVHFLRNAIDYLPRKADDNCLKEPRWLYDRRDITEARKDLAVWLKRWKGKYPKLCGWVFDTQLKTRFFLDSRLKFAVLWIW